MHALLQDLRYGARALLKKPGFTLVAIITLGLGIGANTALFSVVNAVLLDPFPYRDGGRIFQVRQRLPKIGVPEQLRASGPEVVDLAAGQSFERVAAFEPVSRNLTGGPEPERVAAAKVSGDFFALLGVEPVMGRAITAADVGPQGGRVIVLSHGLWQRRFGGSPDALGQKVYLDDEPYTVVGVMPPRFWFDAGEAWFPFPMDFSRTPRSARAFLALVRLKPGVTHAQADAELGALARRQEQAFAGGNPEYAGRGVYLQPLAEVYFGQVRTALLVLVGAVGLILLIACANIANLLLARAAARSREVAVRAALGASRARLVRQMVTESLLLALCGGSAGLLVALWGVGGLTALLPADTLPAGVEVGVDRAVLLFALAASLVTALLFGLWPALAASKPDLGGALKEGGQKGAAAGHARAQSLLVVAEVALSLVLLVMAGLMIRSFARLSNVDPGFDPANLLSMRLNLSPEKYKQGGQKAAFFGQLIERVAALPGVKAAAVASHMPFVYTEDWTVTVEGGALAVEARTQNVDTRTVSPGYFRALGIPLVAGAFFTPQDDLNAVGVAVINRAMARRFWPDEEAVGKRFKVGRADSDATWLTVKGVVADSAQGALDAAVKPEAYFPLAQAAGMYRRMNLAVRSEGDPHALVAAIRREVQALDPNQPVYQIQTMEELIGESVAARRFALRLLQAFAALALVLAAVGIYGVMSYVVAGRTREMGLRLALGAAPRDVLGLVVGQGMRLVLIGTGLGLVAAFGLTRLMTRLLFGVSATDPLTFALVALVLAAVALFACYVPARRAARVDPMVALRCE
jgi:putative ABC transport system permease protein